MTTFIAAIVIFAIMMAFLGLGLFFHRKCIRGTCSGARDAIIGPDGETLTCPRCERELSEDIVARNREKQGAEEKNVK